MKNIYKLIVATLLAVGLIFSVSICAGAAQIDTLSILDDTIYASVSEGEGSTLFAAEYSEGLLVDVFFRSVSENGTVELPVSSAKEFALFVWDKESLAPVSCVYTIQSGICYTNEGAIVPPYVFPPKYTFNQDDAVMIVSSISETEIKGFKAGVETTYTLTDEVAVLGLSDKLSDVVPGSVVLLGTNSDGDCAALELLASIGIPVNEEAFKADFGVYSPADGSTKYENVLDVVFSKSGSKVKVTNSQKTYLFESGSVECYRVGIAMNDESPVITYTKNTISATGDDSIVKSTSEYRNYVYLRVDTEKSKTLGTTTYDGLVTQCIVYAVPTNFNPGAGDGEYSDIFGINSIIID